jgi:hypothetical protein
MIWGVKSKPSPAFPSRVDDWVPSFIHASQKQEPTRKWTIWMLANIGPREAIRVKYVLSARENSHGLLVWKRRRRSWRPGSVALRGLRTTRCSIFRSTFLFFPFFLDLRLALPRDHWRRHLRQNHPRTSLSLLCCCHALGRHPAPSTHRCCAAHRVRI